MRKMRCWKWNFLSQRWKTIKGAPGLRMTRRALSRRVNSELGRVWPDLAWHAARWTPIFRSIWGGILNISQNLTIQSNWSQCEIYTLKYCASARFIRNWIELSEILKFNDYCPSWGENFEKNSIFWSFIFECIYGAGVLQGSSWWVPGGSDAQNSDS